MMADSKTSEQGVQAGSSGELLCPASLPLCSICLQNVRDPRILPCLHSFCKDCLDQLDLRTGQRNEIACPICRSMASLPPNGASGLPKDLTCRTVTSVLTCKECKGDSTSCSIGDTVTSPETWCSRCELAFCKSHAVPHMLSMPGHKLEALDPEQQDKPNVAYVRCCSEHDLLLRYYCKACDTAVCGDCALAGEHSGHKPVVLFKEIAFERQQTVRSKMDRLKDVHLPRIKNCLSALEDASMGLTNDAKRVRSDIEAAGERAVSAIRTAVKLKLNEVDEFEQLHLKSLDSRHDELKSHASHVKSAIGFSERLVKENASCGDVYDLLLAVDSRVTMLGEVDLADEPLVRPHFSFKSVDEDQLQISAAHIVGVVLPYQAKAIHNCTSDGRGMAENASVMEAPVTLVILGRYSNSTDSASEDHAPEVKLPCVLSDTSQSPPLELINNSNGTYQIPCTPEQVGEYSFVVAIRESGLRLEQHLRITCPGLRFDPLECQTQSTVSSDRYKLTYTGKSGWSSVLGSCGLQKGCHMWRVRVSSETMNVCLGIAEKPGLTAKRKNYVSTYSWIGWGCNQWIFGNVNKRIICKWQPDDVLQLELDCCAHVLHLTNVRSGEKSTIKDLPVAEFFPYFALHDHDDSLELLL